MLQMWLAGLSKCQAHELARAQKLTPSLLRHLSVPWAVVEISGLEACP